MVRTLHFHCMRMQVQSLVKELKSLQAVNRSPTKKKKILATSLGTLEESIIPFSRLAGTKG